MNLYLSNIISKIINTFNINDTVENLNFQTENLLLNTYTNDLVTKLTTKALHITQNLNNLLINTNSTDLIFFFSKKNVYSKYFTKKYLFISNELFNINFNFFFGSFVYTLFIIYLLFILIILTYVIILSNLKKNKNEEYDVINAVEIILNEEELGNFEDLKIIFTFLIFTFLIYFSNFFSLIILKNYIYKSLFFIVYLFLFLLILIFSLSFVYYCGIFFINYLRGSSSYNLFIFEFIYDNIALIAFYTRLYLQFFRLILITTVFIEIYEYIHNNILINFIINKIKTWNSYYYTEQFFFTKFNSIFYTIINKLLFIFNLLILAIFNLIHFVYTFMGQLLTFFLIIFNIIIFLYTSFNSVTFENYFLLKKE